MELGVSDTAHTHAANEDVSGMVNLPLSDTFAVRINAAGTNDAGFINQPNLYALDGSGAPVSAHPGNLFSPPVVAGKKGVNDYQYRSARFSALWKPSDELKVQFSYYYQSGNANGFPYVATSLANLTRPTWSI